MKENDYQANVIKRVKTTFPGCFVLKNDANYIQGIPDLSIMHKDKWAFLEVKKSKDEPHQPNQDYYIEVASNISFGAFIFPENEDVIFEMLERYFNGGEKQHAME